MRTKRDATPPSAHRNIDTVAKLEQQALEARTFRDRMGDAIASFIGSMTFVICHFVALVAWVVVNSGIIPGWKPFDPYPYILLTMVVSMEGVIVGTFVLMKQNRMSRRADQRHHLNLQIDLLAEKEVTKMLQMQRLICERMGIREAADDVEMQELSTHTAVEDLARELEKKIPE
jgi:uncharacterized membrane protein